MVLHGGAPGRSTTRGLPGGRCGGLCSIGEQWGWLVWLKGIGARDYIGGGRIPTEVPPGRRNRHSAVGVDGIGLRRRALGASGGDVVGCGVLGVPAAAGRRDGSTVPA